MDQLDREIAAYERVQESLEAEHLGEWVVFHDEELFGCYADFQEAAADAVHNFGRGPYLIRQVGRAADAPPPRFVYQVR